MPACFSRKAVGKLSLPIAPFAGLLLSTQAAKGFFTEVELFRYSIHLDREFGQAMMADLIAGSTSAATDSECCVSGCRDMGKCDEAAVNGYEDSVGCGCSFPEEEQRGQPFPLEQEDGEMVRFTPSTTLRATRKYIEANTHNWQRLQEAAER